MFLSGNRPRAGWLQVLSKTYRNLPFLPVVSWNPGKKTNVISPAPMRWWRMHYSSVHLLFWVVVPILVLYREESLPFNFALRLKFNCEPQWPWQTDPRRYFMHLLVYPNAKITHICSIWYVYVKIDAGNDKIWNALLMHWVRFVAKLLKFGLFIHA